MVKTVYIIHGWDGYPEEGWFPWLKKELEKYGFKVVIPQMPNPEEPRIKIWVSKLQEIAPNPDENSYFIGHSMGCQTIVRYLGSLNKEIKIGGAVFVAGFFKELSNLEPEPEVQEVAKEWLETPINWQKVQDNLLLGQSVAIFSDNDPYVPLSNKEEFQQYLGAKIIVKHAQGHFSGSTGITQLPVVLDNILELAK